MPSDFDDFDDIDDFDLAGFCDVSGQSAATPIAVEDSAPDVNSGDASSEALVRPTAVHKELLQAVEKVKFETFEELLKSLNDAAREIGFRAVKLRSSNYREGKPARYDIECSQGSKHGRKYEVANTRMMKTIKKDCPWLAKAVFYTQTRGWVLEIRQENHNHQPSQNLAPHLLGHRREALTDKVRKAILLQSVRSKTTSIDIVTSLREERGIKLKSWDIRNAVAKDRRERRGPLSDIQEFLNNLRQPGIEYMIRYNEGRPYHIL